MVLRTRLWCFTNFKLDFDYETYLKETTATYVLYGEEKCPTSNRIHHQGFVYFSGARSSVKGVAKQLGKIHVEPCRGNLDQNTDYCSKDDNVTEYGVRPAQGKRVDLDELGKEIAEGRSVDSIAVAAPMAYHQYGRTLNKLEDIALRKKYRTEMTQGTWYWGEASTGKSHRAHEGYDPSTHYVWPNDGGWWDGYKGQETVIINEFNVNSRGGVQYTDLLELVDKWPLFVKRRGREPVPFISKHVIVTCALSPEEAFECQIQARRGHARELLRRFTVVNLTQKYNVIAS